MLKEFPSQSGNASFTINSTNDEWNYSPETTPEWLTVSISSGKLNVSVEANDAHRSRSFNLTVSNDCGLSIPLTIKQAAYTAPIATCYTISEVSLSYSNVDADGGTATPTVSTPTVTAYYDNGTSETVTDAELVYEYTSGGGSGTIVTGKSIDNEDAGKITFDPNSDFSTKTRNVDLEVYVNRFKNACDGSVATASATCQQAARVAQITGYTIQITKFEYGSKVAAVEGTGTPTVNYTVTAKYDDGHTEDVTATKSVTKTFAKVGTGEGTVKTNGNVEYDKNEEEAERTTSVRLTIALADKPEVSDSKDANCIQDAAEKPKVVEINKVTVYVNDYADVSVTPSDANISINGTTYGVLENGRIKGLKIGTTTITGSKEGFIDGQATLEVRDKLHILEGEQSECSNAIIVPGFKSDDPRAFNNILTIRPTVIGHEIGNLTFEVDKGQDRYIEFEPTVYDAEGGKVGYFNIKESTTNNPNIECSQFEGSSVHVTVSSDNSLIDSNDINIIILPEPNESRYFIDVYDSTWGVDNFGPTENYPSTFSTNYRVREMSTSRSYYPTPPTDEEFEKTKSNVLYISFMNEVKRIDRYGDQEPFVYKGPYTQYRNTDSAARYNCSECCNGFAYSWAVLSGGAEPKAGASAEDNKKDCRIITSDLAEKGSNGVIRSYSCGGENLNYGGMSDNDQSEGLTLKDVTGDTNLVVEYIVHERDTMNMATKEWFDGVGMTGRTAYSPKKVGKISETHYTEPKIWNGGGTITIPAHTIGNEKGAKPEYATQYGQVITDNINLSSYTKMHPLQVVGNNDNKFKVGDTRTFTLYSYEFDADKNRSDGPQLSTTDKFMKGNDYVDIKVGDYNPTNHSITFTVTAKKVGYNNKYRFIVKQPGLGDRVSFIFNVTN